MAEREPTREQSMNPELLHVLMQWTAGHFQAMGDPANAQWWNHLQPYAGWLGDYLKTGPTFQVPDDDTALKYLMKMTEIQVAHQSPEWKQPSSGMWFGPDEEGRA